MQIKIFSSYLYFLSLGNGIEKSTYTPDYAV